MSAAVYDVYVKKDDRSLRIATRKGTGLPSHVITGEWELTPSGASQVIDDAEDDIEARGFCFYRLVNNGNGPRVRLRE
jgi:hypothetical protein